MFAVAWTADALGAHAARWCAACPLWSHNRPGTVLCASLRPVCLPAVHAHTSVAVGCPLGTLHCLAIICWLLRLGLACGIVRTRSSPLLSGCGSVMGFLRAQGGFAFKHKDNNLVVSAPEGVPLSDIDGDRLKSEADALNAKKAAAVRPRFSFFLHPFLTTVPFSLLPVYPSTDPILPHR